MTCTIFWCTRQPAGSLTWTGQVELNFVQAWLREPECLVFDHVFDHDDSAALLRLPRSLVEAS